MKKITKIITFVVPLVLSGCSTAKVKEVSFKSYGDEVSASFFAAKYEKRLNDLVSLYYDTSKSNSNPYENLKINLFTSSVEKYEDTQKNQSYTYYQERDEDDHFDYVHGRFLNSIVTKYYGHGDITSIGKFQKLIERENYYAEIQYSKMKRVDMDNCTYQTVSQNYYDFYLSDLLSLFINKLIINDKTSTLYTYYIQDNTYTYVYHENIHNELVMQMNLYDEVDLRVKSIGQSVYQYNSFITIDSVYNAQLTIEITKESVSQLDYSNYLSLDTGLETIV